MSGKTEDVFDCADSNIDPIRLFSKIVTRTDVESTRIERIYPASTLTNAGPHTFVIITDEREWLQPCATRLCGTLSVKEGENVLTAASATDTLVNNTLNSLYKHIQVEINGNIISDRSSAGYPYKSYFEILNSYSTGTSDSHLASQAFWTYDSGDNNWDAITTGPGKAARTRFSKATVDFSLVLHEDFFQLIQLVPGGTRINVTFLRNSEDFLFLQTAPAAGAQAKKYTIEFNKLYLSVKKVRLSERKHAAIENKLKLTKAIYPYSRGIIKTFLLDKNTSSQIISRVAVTWLPRCIIIGLIATDALDGNRQKNPYYFKRHGLKTIQLQYNGTPIPADPLEVGDDQYQDAYRHYLDQIGIGQSNQHNLINLTDFQKGNFLIPFNLTPDQCQGTNHHHEIKNGTINVSLTFDAAVTSTLTMVTYQLYEDFLHIDNNRIAITDYNNTL